MMKPRFFFWTFSLVAALLAVSCASAAPTESPLPAVDSAPVTEPAAPESEPTASAATEAPSVEIPAVAATSRGSNLEATDPTTVNLASGQLQLVEFFRFT
jgi:hypothetical protein